MSYIKRTFHNIKCDCCGELLDPEFWHDETSSLEAVMPDCGWKEIDFKHYCPDCWEYDEDDNIIIIKED